MRARRVRSRVRDAGGRPRLSIFRSNKGVYAQVIDDVKGITLAAASSKELPKGKRTKTQEAEEVGALVAKKASEKGVTAVVFDRGAYLYHGRIKAAAEGARKGGLQF